MKNYKVSLESIIMFFLIIFSLKIGCISYFSSALNVVWYIGSTIAIMYCFIKLLINKKYNLFDLLVLLFYVYLLVITIINHASIPDILKELISFSSLFLVMRYGLETNVKKYVKMMSIILMIYTLINTLSSIAFYPNAMFIDNNNPIFFMGGDNTSIRLYIMAVLFNMLNYYFKNNKVKFPFFSLANLLIFSFVRDLGGGKVCFLVLIIAIIYLINGIKMPKKPVKLIITLSIIIFVLLVIVNRVDVFRYFIINILHRDLSLTDRTIIWNISIEKIKLNPIFGYGMIDGMQFQSYLPYLTGINAHNTYLMVLFDGGIILFSIFILLFIVTALRFDRAKHQKWIYVIPIALLTMMIRAQIEGWDVIWIILLLEMIYSYKKIEQANSN